MRVGEPRKRQAQRPENQERPQFEWQVHKPAMIAARKEIFNSRRIGGTLGKPTKFHVPRGCAKAPRLASGIILLIGKEGRPLPDSPATGSEMSPQSQGLELWRRVDLTDGSNVRDPRLPCLPGARIGLGKGWIERAGSNPDGSRLRRRLRQDASHLGKRRRNHDQLSQS